MPDLSTFAFHSLFCYTLLKGKGQRVRMKTEHETRKAREKYIREMEQYISSLEKENALQRQLIEMLEQQNAVVQRHHGEYVETVHRMMKDFEA